MWLPTTILTLLVVWAVVAPSDVPVRRMERLLRAVRPQPPRRDGLSGGPRLSFRRADTIHRSARRTQRSQGQPRPRVREGQEAT
jgi:hypothetical protein